jgi:nitrate reductase gamma subunit
MSRREPAEQQCCLGVCMTVLLYVVVYASFLVFAIACITRAIRYSSFPLHLRWELYPVPHEPPERVAHGGSYFETSNWWTEKRKYNLGGELGVMIPEMLFLKGLWEFNRRLWRVSFLFHFGLYLLIATIAMVFAAAVLSLGSFTGVAMVVVAVYRGTAALGTLLALAGAAGLLVRRISDKELRNYTNPADIFNLLFFLTTLLVLTAGYVTRPEWLNVQEIARGLLTWDTSVTIPPVFGVGLLLAAALVAYIPLTHMSHFIAKYFTYHNIRWDDAPNMKGSTIEAKIAQQLTYRPTWNASHLAADGKKNWVDIATTNPNLSPTKKAGKGQEVTK